MNYLDVWKRIHVKMHKIKGEDYGMIEIVKSVRCDG